ncbi:MAG: hypothetical protein AAF963_01090 [Bacteroidota bacterium]
MKQYKYLLPALYLLLYIVVGSSFNGCRKASVRTRELFLQKDLTPEQRKIQSNLTKRLKKVNEQLSQIRDKKQLNPQDKITLEKTISERKLTPEEAKVVAVTPALLKLEQDNDELSKEIVDKLKNQQIIKEEEAERLSQSLKKLRDAIRQATREVLEAMINAINSDKVDPKEVGEVTAAIQDLSKSSQAHENLGEQANKALRLKFSKQLIDNEDVREIEKLQNITEEMLNDKAKNNKLSKKLQQEGQEIIAKGQKILNEKTHTDNYDVFSARLGKYKKLFENTLYYVSDKVPFIFHDKIRDGDPNPICVYRREGEHRVQYLFSVDSQVSQFGNWPYYKSLGYKDSASDKDQAKQSLRKDIYSILASNYDILHDTENQKITLRSGHALYDISGKPESASPSSDREYRVADVKVNKAKEVSPYIAICDHEDNKSINVFLPPKNTLHHDEAIDKIKFNFTLKPDKMSFKIEDPSNALAKGDNQRWGVFLIDQESQECSIGDVITLPQYIEPTIRGLTKNKEHYGTYIQDDRLQVTTSQGSCWKKESKIKKEPGVKGKPKAFLWVPPYNQKLEVEKSKFKPKTTLVRSNSKQRHAVFFYRAEFPDYTLYIFRIKKVKAEDTVTKEPKKGGLFRRG